MNRTRNVVLRRHYFLEKDYMEGSAPRENGEYGKEESKNYSPSETLQSNARTSHHKEGTHFKNSIVPRKGSTLQPRN